MSKIILSTISNNQVVQGYLCVDSVESKVARNNKVFLNLTLSDGDLTISAKKWDHVGEMPKAGSVIKVQGTIGEYQGTQQMVVERWRNLTEADVIDIKDFIKRSRVPEKELWDTAQKYISLIQDMDYHNLTRFIFQKYKDLIMTVPAALHHHNAYMNGLIEHLLDVTRMALTMADENTDLNLLIAGAMLHDIGKIYTYAFDGLAIVITDAGKLLEHMIVGTSIIYAEAQTLGIPMDKIMLINHIITSHHGKLEWGSPVTPKLVEAFIVHQADMASVVTTKIHTITEQTAADENWSTYYRDLGTEILTPVNRKYVIDTMPSIFAGETYGDDENTISLDEGVE